MTDAPERELAYQTYINEVTPNGNTRLTNIILSNAGDRAEQHIATQIDIAFQAGWSARATPLADPRVKALQDKAQAVVDRWDSPQWKDLRHTGTHINELRDALSALEENK